VWRRRGGGGGGRGTRGCKGKRWIMLERKGRVNNIGGGEKGELVVEDL
jgi:hypothetical protein